MNIKQIEYAIELSKTRNFSLVAEKLGISQPALSKHISNLEKTLGVVLFDRSSTPIELTAAGEYFFREAKNLLYKEEQLYRSMKNFSDGTKGNLNIGISPFRSLYLISDVCKKVNEKYPDVKIVLHEGLSDVLRTKATEGKFDFAIANLPVDESVLDVIPIEQDTLVLAIPEKYAPEETITLSGNIPHIKFSHCNDIPFIVVTQSQEMRTLFEKLCSSSDITPKISMEVVGLSTAWTMAASGIGATLLPLQFVKTMGVPENIKLFIPECDNNIRRPAIITRHGQFLPDYAKYAIKLLTEQKLL